MVKFGEEPTSPNRERLSSNAENIENNRKQLLEAFGAGDDSMMELGGQMNSLQKQRKEFKNQDEDEARVENVKRQLAEAVAAGDADKIVELAGQMKSLQEQGGESKQGDMNVEAVAKNDEVKIAEVRTKIGGITEGNETKTSPGEALKDQIKGSFEYSKNLPPETDLVMGDIASAFVDKLLSKDASLSDIAIRIGNLSENMKKAAYFHGKAGSYNYPTAHGYGKSDDNFDPNAKDVNVGTWAGNILAGGAGKSREGAKDSEKQADMLRGWIAASFARNINQDKVLDENEIEENKLTKEKIKDNEIRKNHLKFDLRNLADALRVVARVEKTSDQEIANEFADVFSKFRNKSQNKKYLDSALLRVGLVWNESDSKYIG